MCQARDFEFESGNSALGNAWVYCNRCNDKFYVNNISCLSGCLGPIHGPESVSDPGFPFWECKRTINKSIDNESRLK